MKSQFMRVLKQRPFQLPLRLRLTIWYTLSLAFILLLFTLFLYIQVRRTLIAQADTALQLTANQAVLGIEVVAGELNFTAVSTTDQPIADDFVIQLLTPSGRVTDRLNHDDEMPRLAENFTGFQTAFEEGEPWRIYRQSVEVAGVDGFIQTAQELETVFETLNNLLRQMGFGLPIALVLASVGGYFLAFRALRPIDQMTQTAQAIRASDLSQRIDYSGPADEVGRLAQTFDSMLDRLESAFVRERRFTGDAAHELRTPLTALKGRIEVTLSQSRTTAVYQETLEEMAGQVDRLIRLSSDLLFMARLEQANQPLDVESLALADFLGALVDQIRPLAQSKQITLIETIPDTMHLHANMDLLIRLFLNLLDNAVKYTPNQGEISVKATAEPGSIVVSIADSGVGISPEHLPHLFDRFYRVDADRSRLNNNGELGGAGLGLAIAYEIATGQGGDLWVESQPGKGSTFFVRLPS